MPPNKKDQAKLNQMRDLLTRKQRTVSELSEALAMTRRSVYRYIDQLLVDGHNLKRSVRRPTAYYIEKSNRPG